MKYRKLLLVELQGDDEKTFPVASVKVYREVTGDWAQMGDWPCILGYQGNK